jgi:cytidylate kinase
MIKGKTRGEYAPGMRAMPRPDAARLANQFIQEWEQRRIKLQVKRIQPSPISPAICFSRKIGAGALKIADLLAEKINFRLVDRELLEYMAKDKDLREKTVEFFDERYPGKISELGAMLLGEKSFILSDYVKNLIRAAYAFATMGSTVFVGRGTHLILPRDRVLAVRVICSENYRIERLSQLLNIEKNKAANILPKIDQEQRTFFKKAFGKKDASPYEFDVIINLDFFTGSQAAAEVIACAFKAKFSA